MLEELFLLVQIRLHILCDLLLGLLRTFYYRLHISLLALHKLLHLTFYGLRKVLLLGFDLLDAGGIQGFDHERVKFFLEVVGLFDVYLQVIFDCYLNILGITRYIWLRI
jgi:hypothetical protein